MADETTLLAAAPVSATTVPAPQVPETSSVKQDSVASGAIQTSADDFDENIIPEGSRENFKKYREAQKLKYTGLENKLNEETRQRLAYESKVREYNARQLEAQNTAPSGEEPDYRKFETVEAYRDAVAAHVKAQAIHEFKQTQTTNYQQEQYRQQLAKDQQKLNVALAKYPDFRDVVVPIAAAADQIPMLGQFIREFDNGMDVVYHLGKNPTALEALSRMQPFAAGQELLRIQAALSTPATKLITQAPPPLNPVNTGGDGSVKSVLEMVKKEDVSDYIARENRAELRRRKGA